MSEIPITDTKLLFSMESNMTEAVMAIDDSNKTCAITSYINDIQWWAGKLDRKTIISHVELAMSSTYERNHVLKHRNE